MINIEENTKFRLDLLKRVRVDCLHINNLYAFLQFFVVYVMRLPKCY